MNEEEKEARLKWESKQYMAWEATRLEYEPAILYQELYYAWDCLESYRLNGIRAHKQSGDINKLKEFLNFVSSTQEGLVHMMYVLKKIAYTGMFEQLTDQRIQKLKASRTEYKEDGYDVDPPPKGKK